MDSDEEDFVFVGTPIEREEELTSRKKKALAETSGHLRTLPSWKQEVRDEEGRRRFHGAFTGGFSAGYYNTVGSKEGWTPQTFSSSRKNRAEVKKQSVLDFLDEDERVEMEGHLLGTSSQFDTFGFTAAELARKQVEKEQKQRPSAIPGPVPDELVVPATESVGVKLLMKMGWRRGRSIKDSRSTSLHEFRREARKAFLALSSNDKDDDSEPVVSGLDDLIGEHATDDAPCSQTPVYVRQPKQDMYGLGYDPYKHAPEFREMKRSRSSENKEIVIRKPFALKQEPAASKSRRLAPGFGIGALEELDAEDEDIYGSGYDYAETYVVDDKEPSGPSDDSHVRAGKDMGFVPRFKVASNSEYQLERFEPPAVPGDFVARHKFPAPLDTNNLPSCPSPLEVPPPEDNNLKIMIEGVAALAARCGKLFEDISREKNKSNPLFDFLNGGRGHDYYARKLWEAQQKHNDQIKWRPDEKLYSTVHKMTAESRGKILGERPLERSLKDSSSSPAIANHVQFQSSMSDTFTKPEAFRELLETAKPFRDDPAKQERFEQFLKDKYQGGLRTTDSGKSSDMSEAARARERLDFEAAAEAIEKAKSANQSKLSAQQFMEFTMATGLQFISVGVEHGKTSSTEELISKKVYPKREEFQWRPAPLLCRRFDIVDPYMGKPPPPPRARSKLDLIFTPDSTKFTKSEDNISDQWRMPSKSTEAMAAEVGNKEPEVAVEVENVERPVDLYKAIFSDDSDDEVEPSGINQTEDPQKKTEAASAALSRIVAGDFLESLGKELGLEVPPDLPPPPNKPGNSSSSKPVPEDSRITSFMPPNLPASASDDHESKLLKQVVDDENREREKSPSMKRNNSDAAAKLEREDRREKKAKYDSGSSSYSDDERSRKRSRRHRHRPSSSDSDSSEDRHGSRSRDHKRRSSRKKHRRRKHSKHK